MTILQLDNLAVSFGGLAALDSVSFSVEPGEIYAVIGPNGAGKTTLFNIISGIYLPNAGSVQLDGQAVTGMSPHKLARRGLSRTFQNLQVFFRMRAVENVMVGGHLTEGRNTLAHIFNPRATARQNRESRIRAEELLDWVGLGGMADMPASQLSYGALKRLEIARAMASQPRLLLLDEPAAGCNAVETEEIDAVIRAIAERGVAVVLVEHDMRLVMKISQRIHVLDQGKTLAEGDAASISGNPEVIAAYLGAQGGREARHA